MTVQLPDRLPPADCAAGGPATTRRRVLRTATAAATGGLLLSGTSDAASAAVTPSQRGTPIIGANVNGGAPILNANGLVERSNTTHVRARLDIREKAHNGTAPDNDPDVEALRQAAREHDCTLIISLLWDFAGQFGKSSVSVPAGGSQRDRTLKRTAAKYLRALGDAVDTVVLGNEPLWETRDDDLSGDPAPFIQFVRRVKAHLDGPTELLGGPAYLVGALNRLYDEPVRRNHSTFLDQMFELARSEEFEGLDLHVHYDTFDEAETMVRIGREEVPNGRLDVTEFSAVHRYHRHMDATLGTWDRGQAFAAEYGYAPSTTVFDYVRAAANTPRPRDEIGTFYRVMPWYNPDQIEDLRTLFTKFAVDFGGIGFAHGYRARQKHFDAGWRQWPFHLNQLFQPGIIQAPDGIQSAPHPLFMDDYRG